LNKATKEAIKKFREKFPSIMGKNDVKHFPREAFYDLEQFLIQELEKAKEETVREIKIKIESCIYTQEQINKEPVISMQDEMIHENRGVFKALYSLSKKKEKIK